MTPRAARESIAASSVAPRGMVTTTVSALSVGGPAQPASNAPASESRNAERGTATCASIGCSAFPVPRSAFSYGGAPPGIQIVLQQQGGGEGVDVGGAAARLAAHLVDGLPHARRGHPFVP